MAQTIAGKNLARNTFFPGASFLVDAYTFTPVLLTRLDVAVRQRARQ